MTHPASPSGSNPQEAIDFLEAHRDIEAVDIVIHDSNGIGRGKIIRRHELLSFYQNGRHLPISILGLDIVGEDVDATGLVWDHGDNDLRAWPIPGTLCPLVGTSPPRAEVLMSLYELDGRQMTSDPRHALQQQVQAMHDEGLYPAGAFELEFFLVSSQRGPDGKLRPAEDVLDGRQNFGTDVYSVDHLHGMQPLFSDVYEAAEKAGIKAETLISEYAPGQYELTLHYRSDIVKAADDLVRLKRIVRQAARRHGATACFMAKPFEHHAGSGMHFHVSLSDKDGTNVFLEEREGDWSKTILHAIGGLRETMGESLLVFAPHANSWRRFSNQSYAPVNRSWGFNNRSVALRIPAGNPKARRIEHRLAGVDANPYLVAATVLAGMRLGIAKRIDPGLPTTGNGYEKTVDDKTIPVDWRSAIEAAANSDFLKNALGADMQRTFIEVKRAEYARIARSVSEMDYDLYLHRV